MNYTTDYNRILRLNIKLLQTLGKVLDMTNTELMGATGIKNATWYRIMGNPDEITIQQLLSIANGLHIPVTWFFSFGDTDIICSKGEYVRSSYKNCYYNSEALASFVNTRSVATWQSIANSLGMTRTNLRNSLLSVTRLPVARLLSVCNVFDMDPFFFIIDPNPPHAVRREKEDNDVASGKYEKILENIASMQREMAYFKVLLEETKRDIAELGKKLDEVAGVTEVQPIAWIARRAASEIAKIAKEAQELNKKLIVNDK